MSFSKHFINTLILPLILIGFSISANSQTIFSETFGDGEDATTGTEDIGGVDWSTTCTECIDDGDYYKIVGEQLVGQDSNGPAQWETGEIDISSCGFIEIEFDLSEEGTMEACGTGCNAVDYVQLEFNIDGTGWTSPADASFCAGDCADVLVIQSDDIDGGSLHYTTGCISGGDILEIRITIQAWASSERWIIDNVEVSCTDGPEIDAGEDQIICEGTDITLTADNPDGADLSWDHGVTDGVSFTQDLGTVIYTVSAALGECTATDEVSVEIVSSVTVSVVAAGPYTTSSGIATLSASPSSGTWTASCGACIDAATGEFDPAVAGAGTWEICYTAGVDPCDDTECITIIVISMDCDLSADITFNNPTCFGYSDGSATINVTGTTGDITFIITDEDGTVVNIDNSNTANTLNEGWYYFNVTDEIPCTYIDSVFLNDPDQMTVDLGFNNPLCYGDNSGFAYVDSVYKPTGNYDAISFIWAPASEEENGIGKDSLFSLQAGEYTLTINDENGCNIRVDFILENPDSLYFSELGYHPSFCRLHEYQNGNGVVYAGVSGGTPNINQEWENLQTGETSINGTWGGRNPGDYRITAIDENDCVISQIITIDSLSPIASFDMESPQFTTEWEGTATVDIHFLNTSINFANPYNPLADTSFFWYFDLGEGAVLSKDLFEELDRSYAIAQDYEICLVVQNQNGCLDSACVIVTVHDPFLFIPVNVFTPNNDGINDNFTFAEYAQSVETFNCEIFNRWGIKITTMTDINEEWNGSLPNGNPASAGTYFYIYSGESFNGTKFEGQGTVQLVDY